MLKGFREFITRGNVVDLAVAVIIGGAFGKIINSLVEDVLTPMLGAWGGVPDFSQWALGPVKIGNFINAIVNFLVVAAAIYLIVVAPLQRMQQRQQSAATPAPPPEPSEEVKLLREILETLKTRGA
ncbi:MAG: large-conductance mechanosensitive channel [Fimbriimonadales bacterium]|nr:MAG: large-conductance mechanosensitive channel [Fimbriimonadales bacterium]